MATRAMTATATAVAASSPLNLLRASLSGLSGRNGLWIPSADEERRLYHSGDLSTRSFSSVEAPREEKDASTSSTTATSPSSSTSTNQKKVIYRAQGMVPLRLAVRLKVFHLLAAASAAGPAATLAGGGTVPPLDAALAATLAASAGGAAAALAWLSRRYVGEISVSSPSQQRVTISTLGFWGERVDSEFPASAVVPALAARATRAEAGSPSSSSSSDGGSESESAVAAKRTTADALIAARPLLAFDIEGDRQFLVSLRFSALCDREAMIRLLSGGGV